MQKFYDYNPDNPFDVTDDKVVINGGKGTLSYTPMKGTVTAKVGDVTLKEVDSPSLKDNEFYIDYQENSQYRNATQTIMANVQDGSVLTLTYKGVSTIIFAKHMNEIRDFMMDESREKTVKLASGISCTAGQILGYKAGGYTIADSNDADTLRYVVLAISNSSSDGFVNVLTQGEYAISSYPDGKTLYIGENGGIVTDAPTKKDANVKIIGISFGDKILFNPDNSIIQIIGKD